MYFSSRLATENNLNWKYLYKKTPVHIRNPFLFRTISRAMDEPCYWCYFNPLSKLGLDTGMGRCWKLLRCLQLPTIPLRLCRPPHLDPANCFLGLHHAHIFGGSFVWEQLGGAKIIGSKNDSIDQIFRVARSRNCNTERIVVSEAALGRPATSRLVYTLPRAPCWQRCSKASMSAWTHPSLPWTRHSFLELSEMMQELT